jgi:FAD:protein FMN transferase
MIFQTKQFVFLAGLICLDSLHCPAQDKANGAVAAVATSSEVAGYEFSFPALGTLVQLKVFSDEKRSVERAVEEIQRETKRLESILTDYDSESETRKLTIAAFGQPQPVSEELWQVLAASDRWHTQTGGAFDSSLGKLTQLWRKSRREKTVPTKEQVQEALWHSGWEHVRLNEHMHTVELLREGIQFDFGAIGKGYVADQVYNLLMKHELPCCLVNISGNMRLGIAPPEREGWRIEISPLEKDGQSLRRVVLSNKAIATSGDLWQFSVIDGVRRSHILHPKNGLGVRGPIAATVIAETATEADAFATAACVLESQRSIELAGELSGIELLIASRFSEADAVEAAQTAGFPDN